NPRTQVITMTAPHIVDPAGLVSQALAEASPDLMRELLQTMMGALLSADAAAVCGAEWVRSSDQRTNHRNGYRHRPLDTRVGTIDVAVPKLRTGTYFPEWLLERRKRAESALITVVADCYLAGVSTRRMDKLVKTLGIDSLSKSQVSRMAEDLERTGRGVPALTAGCGRAVHVRHRRCADDQGPREQAGRQSRRAAGHRRQRGRAPRSTRHAGRHQRNQRPPGTPSSPTWSPAASAVTA